MWNFIWTPSDQSTKWGNLRDVATLEQEQIKGVHFQPLMTTQWGNQALAGLRKAQLSDLLAALDAMSIQSGSLSCKDSTTEQVLTPHFEDPIMRILCLHAMGTSSAILEKQLAPIRRALGDGCEWVFVDGPHEHAPPQSITPNTISAPVESDGLPAIREPQPGPYFCYHSSLSAHDQADAHAFIEEVIDEDGPFDGILGFSQGASLAASFLLQRKIEKPYDAAPFGFAILLSANVVVSPDQKFCEQEIVKEASKAQKTSRFSLLAKQGRQRSPSTIMAENRPALQSISKHKIPGKQSQVVDEVLGLLDLSINAAESEGWIDRQTAGDGKTVDDFPRVVHPMALECRIDVPVAVIVGKNDPLFLCSLVAKRLCRKGLRKFVVHHGAHDVPRAGSDLDSAVQGCRWVLDKAKVAVMGGVL